MALDEMVSNATKTQCVRDAREPGIRLSLRNLPNHRLATQELPWCISEAEPERWEVGDEIMSVQGVKRTRQVLRCIGVAISWHTEREA